jgi:hypothetical protein
MRGFARVGTVFRYLQGFSVRTACRASQSEQDNGWFFGSGATRSRARITKDKVRACRGGGVGGIIDGGWDGWGTTGTFALYASTGAGAFYASAGADPRCSDTTADALYACAVCSGSECADARADAAESSGG